MGPQPLWLIRYIHSPFVIFVAESRKVDHSNMAPLTRRQVLAMLGAGGGLLGLGMRYAALSVNLG